MERGERGGGGLNVDLARLNNCLVDTIMLGSS